MAHKDSKFLLTFGVMKYTRKRWERYFFGMYYLHLIKFEKFDISIFQGIFCWIICVHIVSYFSLQRMIIFGRNIIIILTSINCIIKV